MPNWVCNHLVISGDNAVEVMRSILTKNEDNECGYEVDFNKVIPMPEELDIVSGTITDNSVILYLRTILEQEKDFDKFDKLVKIYMSAFGKSTFSLANYDCPKMLKNLLGYKDFESKEILFKNESDVYAYGKRALDNYVKYGAKDWYDWRIDNWGTKWNACDTQINDPQVADIYFNTAWSAVPYIIAKLAEDNPDCKFEYEYAEEDAGANAGYIDFENGEVTGDEHYDDFSKEAYEKFFALWGREDEFKFNPKKGTYEYIDAEAME